MSEEATRLNALGGEQLNGLSAESAGSARDGHLERIRGGGNGRHYDDD